MPETQKKSLGWNFKPSQDYEEDWDAYFQEYQTQLAEIKDVAQVDKRPRITVPGREASGDDPIAAQNFDWADLLHLHGWTYKVGYAQVFQPSTAVNRRDRTYDISWIDAIRNNERVSISYRRDVSAGGWACTDRWIQGRETKVMDADFKKEVTCRTKC